MTNLNHGLFRQFISTLSDTAGSFVKAFDTNNDEVVTKAEFQAKMWGNQTDYVNNWDGNANNTSEYRDLINEFWNSFDDIYKKGNIKDTNIEHAFAIDKTEQKDVQREMDVYFNIASIMQFSGLKQYAHTYNFISNKIAEVILADESGNTTVTEDDFKKLLADILTNQSPDFKKAILNDALEMIVSNTRYTTTNGYNPLEDSELISRVADKIATLTFKEGDDPVQAVVNYFNETQGENFTDMKAITKEYLGDTTLADPRNNYQIARLTNTYISELDNYINNNIGTNPNVTGDLLKKAQTKGLEAIKLAVNILLEVNNDKTHIDQLYNTIYNIETTDPGKDYKNYLYSLSLGDVNIDDEFYNEFLEILKEKYPVGNEAEQIADALANMDRNYPEYQYLIEEIANTVSDFNDGKVYTESDIRKILLDKLLNGNIKDVNGVEGDPWIDKIIKESKIVPTEVMWMNLKDIRLNPGDNKNLCDIGGIYKGGNEITQDASFTVSNITPSGTTITISSNGKVSINAPEIEKDTPLTFTVSAKLGDVDFGAKNYTFTITNEKVTNTNYLNSEGEDYKNIKKGFSTYWYSGELAYDIATARSKGMGHINNVINKLKDAFGKLDYDTTRLEKAAEATRNYYQACIDAIYIYDKSGENYGTVVDINILYDNSNGKPVGEETTFYFSARNPDQVADHIKYASGSGICLSKDCGTKNDRGLNIIINNHIILDTFVKFFNEYNPPM